MLHGVSFLAKVTDSSLQLIHFQFSFNSLLLFFDNLHKINIIWLTDAYWKYQFTIAFTTEV